MPQTTREQFNVLCDFLATRQSAILQAWLKAIDADPLQATGHTLTPEEDMWDFSLPDGRTPRRAIEFIFPYLADKNKWIADGYHKDVMRWESWPVRQPCLLFAYVELGEEKYFELWKKLEPDPADLEVRRNLAITQPLLWLSCPDDIPLVNPNRSNPH